MYHTPIKGKNHGMGGLPPPPSPPQSISDKIITIGIGLSTIQNPYKRLQMIKVNKKTI